MKTLPPAKLLEASFKRSHFYVEVPNDVSLEDVMTPGFWRDHSGSMKVGTVVEVVRSDMTLDLTARVVSSSPGMVTLRALFPPINDERNLKLLRQEEKRRLAEKSGEGGDEGAELPPAYKVKHSPATGYYVLFTDGSGNAVNLTAGQKNLSKEQASAIALDHHKKATTATNMPKAAA